MADKIFKYLLSAVYSFLLLVMLFLTTAIIAFINHIFEIGTDYIFLNILLLLFPCLVYVRVMYFLIIIESELRKAFKNLNS